jgi:DNA processing protein
LTEPALPRTEKIPPAALPADDDALRDWLRLARSRRVGPATFIRLMREHGSAAASLAALPGVAAAAGVRDYAVASRADVEAEWRAGIAAGARLLALGTPDYPPLLAAIADPPPVLWARGDPRLAARRAVALVGARNASALGGRMATRLAAELGSAGFVVVSGLARGVDAAAHAAALPTGTIAAVAGGVDVVYPPENAALTDGLILSEMPMGHAPRAQDFPRRNRVISGLALGVVVVEGAERSGSLITAREALDQGREVMAVPGSPLDPRAGGCNQLIRDGATLIRSAEDVLAALAGALVEPARQPPASPVVSPVAPSVTSLVAPTVTSPARAATDAPPRPQAPPRPEPAPTPQPTLDADALAEKLFDLIGPAPVAEDALTRAVGLPAPQVAALLFEFEMEGLVLRHPGGTVSRAP